MGSRLTYLIDKWVIGHILLWAVFGWWAWSRKDAGLGITLLCGLFLGLTWEVLERYIEILVGFREYPLNSWLVDPVSDVFGTFLGWVTARRLAMKTFG